MSTNRREFLQGGLALTGLIGASGLATAAEIASPGGQAATAQPSSIESWLLETGRRELDEATYRTVADGHC